MHGTVNDLAMAGAKPLYLSAGFIIEEGFPLADLKRIVESMARASREAGVPVVTGDTKVVEKGKGDGIFINTATALLFLSGSKHDLNIRGAFLHMAADALVSVGVLVSGVLIGVTGLLWIDPVTSLVIVAVIAVGTWGLLKDSVKLSLLGVPPGISHAKVEAYLRAQPGVASVHDLHIWPLGTTETVLTAHLVIPGGHPGDAFLRVLAADMKAHFRIGQSTIQIEVSDGEPCALDG